MVKHTQTICWQIADELLSEFAHFVGLALKVLMTTKNAKKNLKNCKYRYDKKR